MLPGTTCKCRTTPHWGPFRRSYSGVVTFAKDKEAIVHLPPHYDSGRHYRATISYQARAPAPAARGASQRS